MEDNRQRSDGEAAMEDAERIRYAYTPVPCTHHNCINLLLATIWISVRVLVVNYGIRFTHGVDFLSTTEFHRPRSLLLYFNFNFLLIFCVFYLHFIRVAKARAAFTSFSAA